MRVRTLSVLILLALAVSVPVAMAKGGFDQYGYNYQARLFNGLLGNADRDSDPITFWGGINDVTPLDTDGDGTDDTIITVPVAGTHLVMKWDKAWDNYRFGGGPLTVGMWCTNHDMLDGTSTGSILWPDGTITILNNGVFFKIEYVGQGGNFRWWGIASDGTGVFEITIQSYS